MFSVFVNNCLTHHTATTHAPERQNILIATSDTAESIATVFYTAQNGLFPRPTAHIRTRL